MDDRTEGSLAALNYLAARRDRKPRWPDRLTGAAETVAIIAGFALIGMLAAMLLVMIRDAGAF
jgi:hypothetical protein